MNIGESNDLIVGSLFLVELTVTTSSHWSISEICFIIFYFYYKIKFYCLYQIIVVSCYLLYEFIRHNFHRSSMYFLAKRIIR